MTPQLHRTAMPLGSTRKLAIVLEHSSVDELSRHEHYDHCQERFNQNVTATLPVTDSRVSLRARDGNSSLLRIETSPDKVGFVTTTTTSSIAEGEGSSHSAAVASTSSNGLQAEGEGIATPPVTTSSSSKSNGTSSTSDTTKLDPQSVDNAMIQLQPNANSRFMPNIDTLTTDKGTWATSSLNALKSLRGK